MKEKFNSVKEKLKTVWGGLAKAAKILIISALIVIIVGSVGLTVFLNKKSSSDWIVLFPDMSQEESTEVYLELQNRGVDTKINSDGEIEVKRGEWDSLVFEMAELGYPQSAPSYGTFFDNLGMTMTEFEKKQTLRFELQDRLQTTLKRIDGVVGAIVTINVPEKDGYAWTESSDKASASVTLTLSNSAGFTPANVSAVKKLVAYSAQKMEPEDVTVIDSTSGRELQSQEEADAVASNTVDMETKMEYTNTFKSMYEANAKEILQNIYPEGVDAVAAVELDYDKIVEERRELLTDENGESVKSKEHVSYNTENTPVDEGGVTGEENNSDIPNYQNNAEDELNSDNTPHYDRETEWIDPGYVLTQTEKEQGVVKSATISVVVTTENAYLSRDERNAVIQLVKNATNINEENISVYSRESGKLPVAAGDESITSKLGLDTKKLIILLGLCGFVFLAVALIVIFMIIRSMKKKMKRQQEENDATIQGLQNTIDENNRKTLEEAAEEHNKAEKAAEIEVKEFAKNNPEIAAALIRSMLKERGE